MIIVLLLIFNNEGNYPLEQIPPGMFAGLGYLNYEILRAETCLGQSVRSTPKTAAPSAMACANLLSIARQQSGRARVARHAVSVEGCQLPLGWQ